MEIKKAKPKQRPIWTTPILKDYLDAPYVKQAFKSAGPFELNRTAFVSMRRECSRPRNLLLMPVSSSIVLAYTIILSQVDFMIVKSTNSIEPKNRNKAVSVLFCELVFPGLLVLTQYLKPTYLDMIAFQVIKKTNRFGTKGCFGFLIRSTVGL